MKKNEVKIGGTYLAKVSERVVPIRIEAESRHGGWDATNLATNKRLRIKSPQRLRGEVNAGTKSQSTAPLKADSPEPREPKTKQPKPKASTAAVAKPEKAKKASGLDVAFKVLTQSSQPMSCREIVQKMLDENLWKTSGATPHATIYAAMIREIQTKGQSARFVKVDRGRFTAAKVE
jgi:hypothetical protein